MDTRDFKETRKKLIDKFEKNCEKSLNNINKLRIEEMNKLEEELRDLKAKLIVIGFVMLVLNIVFTFFSGIIAIIVLAIIYFGKKIKSTIKIQDILKNKVENLTLDYVSLLFTDIQKKKTDLYSSKMLKSVKEVIKVERSENIVFGNVFFGKYRDVNFEIAETMVQSLIEKEQIFSFNGTVYKLHFNSIYKNNTVLKEIANKINDILGKCATSVMYDYDGNLIFALNYKIANNIEIKIDKPIKAPIVYLTELMEHLFYICQIIDTVQDYEKKTVAPDEIKKKLAQKINEIVINKTSSQPETEPIISEPKPIKKENTPISQIKNIIPQEKPKELIGEKITEEPKNKEPEIIKTEVKEPELKAIPVDTIDLMDIMEF